MGTHTERFNAIMKAGEQPRKPKQKQVEIKQIKPRDNMNELQTSLSKCTISGNILHLPTENLTNYADVRKALLNAGGQYKRNTFVFNSDPTPFIERLMGGDSVNIKKEFQFFPTPKAIVLRMLDEVLFHDKIKTILEPSAGQGAIIEEINKRVQMPVDYCELMPENKQILEGRKLNARFICDDFITMKGFECYDLILMNPPFTKNQDIKHIMKAWGLLRKGGQLIAITSNSWTFANNSHAIDFRNFLNDEGAEWQEIGAGEFKESGTNIKTVMVTLNK